MDVLPFDPIPVKNPWSNAPAPSLLPGGTDVQSARREQLFFQDDIRDAALLRERLLGNARTNFISERGDECGHKADAVLDEGAAAFFIGLDADDAFTRQVLIAAVRTRSEDITQ